MENLPAIHARHADVQDHKGDVVCRDRLLAGGPVLGCQHFVAGTTQVPGEELEEMCRRPRAEAYPLRLFPRSWNQERECSSWTIDVIECGAAD
jgi:hypothetical protein